MHLWVIHYILRDHASLGIFHIPRDYASLGNVLNTYKDHAFLGSR